MNRLTLPASLALAVTASLTLAACGGGGSDGSEGSGRSGSAGADSPRATPSGTSQSPSSPSPPPSAGAPAFAVPSDVTITFEGFDTAGGGDHEVVRDARYAITALLEAEATVHTQETPNFRRYWTGASGATYADTIIARGRQGKVVTGAYRYYAVKVTRRAGGGPVVSYCEDQRKAYAKNANTGKVTVTTPSLSDFRAWALTMAEDPDGDWQVASYTWKQGAKECQVL